jgi:hypothetical protein
VEAQSGQTKTMGIGSTFEERVFLSRRPPFSRPGIKAAASASLLPSQRFPS